MGFDHTKVDESLLFALSDALSALGNDSQWEEAEFLDFVYTRARLARVGDLHCGLEYNWPVMAMNSVENQTQFIYKCRTCGKAYETWWTTPGPNQQWGIST